MGVTVDNRKTLPKIVLRLPSGSWSEYYESREISALFSIFEKKRGGVIGKHKKNCL